jgi:hypothetical protein
LPTSTQGAIAFSLFAVVLFLANMGIFNQPLIRSAIYGLIEAAPLTAMVLVATANERQRRRRDPDGSDPPPSRPRPR